MRYRVVIILMLILSTAFGSCTEIVGNREMMNESRDVSGFKSIELSVPADVYFTISESFDFNIDGESNIVPEIVSYVKNDVLTIEYKDKINFNYQPLEKIKIIISAPQLIKLTASGASNFYTNAEIREGSFSCKASGASNINLAALLIDKGSFISSGASNINVEDIKTNELHVKATGASNVSVIHVMANQSRVDQSGASTVKIKTGNTQALNLDLSGSADFETQLFLSKNASVSTSGAAEATVFVEQDLKIKSSGASTVHYIGNPSTDIRTSGAASVKNKPMFEQTFFKYNQ